MEQLAIFHLKVPQMGRIRGADGVRHERLKDAESNVPTRKFDRS